MINRMSNTHYRRNEEENKCMCYLIWGTLREEKLATECVYLVQRTMYIWCSMASAAVHVVGSLAFVWVVIGTVEVDVPSGVLYGEVLV